MKKVLLFFAVGSLIALAAHYIIIPLLAGLFSGEYMFSMVYGAVLFLIVVIITCTGIIVYHIEKNK